MILMKILNLLFQLFYDLKAYKIDKPERIVCSMEENGNKIVQQIGKSTFESDVLTAKSATNVNRTNALSRSSLA